MEVLPPFEPFADPNLVFKSYGFACFIAINSRKIATKADNPPKITFQKDDVTEARKPKTITIHSVPWNTPRRINQETAAKKTANAEKIIPITTKQTFPLLHFSRN
jgi:hypothetical protein